MREETPHSWSQFATHAPWRLSRREREEKPFSHREKGWMREARSRVR
jgi:hypothetical protein